jgi:hypothetical protein
MLGGESMVGGGSLVGLIPSMGVAAERVGLIYMDGDVDLHSSATGDGTLDRTADVGATAVLVGKRGSTPVTDTERPDRSGGDGSCAVELGVASADSQRQCLGRVCPPFGRGQGTLNAVAGGVVPADEVGGRLHHGQLCAAECPGHRPAVPGNDHVVVADFGEELSQAARSPEREAARTVHRRAGVFENVAHDPGVVRVANFHARLRRYVDDDVAVSVARR